jgi:hypothetical protein
LTEGHSRFLTSGGEAVTMIEDYQYQEIEGEGSVASKLLVKLWSDPRNLKI